VAAATAFIDWLPSPDGKASIGSHQVNGEQLFVPSDGPTN
jgi:ABC-type tungstate transport system permease subunit